MTTQRSITQMKNSHVAATGGDLAEDCGILGGDADETLLMDEVGSEIWLDDHGGDNNQHHEDDDLVVHHDPSILFEDLPTLPDFSCMSSSSSTSPVPINAIVSSASSSTAASSSNSSAASWAILKSEGENLTPSQNQYGSGKCDESSGALLSTASMEIPLDNSQGFGEGGGDCIDMMETFGYMDLLDSNEFFDTSAIFSQDDDTIFSQDDDTPNPNLMDQTLERQQQQEEDQVVVPMMENNIGGDMQMMNTSLEQDDDLASVFLEWLKNNKETVSAEDLRKVKIKKATIEAAARKLGGGKEAMKHLLKLILEWVQTNHLQRRRTINNTNNNLSYQRSFQQDPFQNPNPNNNNLIPPSDQSCFSPTTWLSPPPPPPQQAFVSDPCFGYMPAPSYPPPLLESPPSWPTPQSCSMPHQQFPIPSNSRYNRFGEPTGYNMNPYQHPCLSSGQMRDQRLLPLCSSATKEARRKRMARQRRFVSHHNRNKNNQQNQTQIGESCAPVAQQLNPGATTATGGTWVYCPNVLAVPPQLPTMDRVNNSSSAIPQQQMVQDRRQEWKQEKNLRFLLQKVLKQSDVGSLGRIVLPKKEAETHLPELEARDGICLAMEDVGTSRVWNMRYRFWPNNKSRMYLLENTGDFVKTNELEEGDFIVIYSDVRCGKYLIRGVKVREPTPGQNTEAPPPSKRQNKSQRNINNNSPSANVVVASPTS